METAQTSGQSISGRYDVPFLLERYTQLQEYLKHASEAAQSGEEASNRRHDLYLRSFINRREYGDALMYVNSIIDFLDAVDQNASARYRRYRDRVVELFMNEY